MALKSADLQWADDGTLRSVDFGDIYFQPGKGPEESDYVFLQGNGLGERFSCRDLRGFHIAELGFGTGLNFLLTARLWLEKSPPDSCLHYVSFEKHPVRKEDLERIYGFWPELSVLSDAVLAQYPPLIAGFHTLFFPNARVTLTLVFGDVAETLPETAGSFNAWYLDGFAPAKNPDMWGDALFPLIAERTRPGGTLATFTAAGAVRRGLSAAGFKVEKVKGYGVKRDMTVAWKEGVSALPPLLPRVAVLGAGIAGCAAAYAFARRRCAVVLLDRNAEVGAETSGNPVGIAYPKMTVDVSAAGDFHQHAFCFTRNLAAAIGLPSWTPCGVYHLDETEEDRQRSGKLISRNGFPPEYARVETEPFSHKPALFQPMAGHLSPPEFCGVLAGHPCIEKRFGADIGDLRQENGLWRVYDGKGNDLASADIVVVALGNGSRRFPETEWLPLQSLRGQVTVLRATETSREIGHVICHDGYITPAVGGLHVTGATFQKEGPGLSATRDEDDAENISKLNAALPACGFAASHVAGSRAGYRAATPDKLPLVGRCPDYAGAVALNAPLRQGPGRYQATGWSGFYLSCGFGAHGMTGAPLAGEIIAATALGLPLPVPQSLRDALLPDRFIDRALRRRQI